MFCRYCGKNIAEDSLFCPYCGKDLTLKKEPAQEQVSEQNQEETLAPELPPIDTEESIFPQVQDSQNNKEYPGFVPLQDPKRWAILGGIVAFCLAVIAVLFLTKVLCFHSWQDATCTEPMTCARCHDTKGEANGHKKRPATCTMPQGCFNCDETFGGPLGHTMRNATCTLSKTCMRCHKPFGDPLGHSWIEETQTTPKTCETCGKMEPMSLPESGTVFIDAKKYYGSSLTFEAAADYSTYVKLKDESGNDVIAFFVKAGESAKVRVPTGNYYLYMAHGYDWYGPEHAFGEETYYEKEESLFDFYTYYWTYTMDVEDGNGVTTEVDGDTF